MLEPIYQRQFKKDILSFQKRGKDVNKLKVIIGFLLEETPLPLKNHNHKLKGEFKNCWECNVEPDWLLIYKKTKTEIILIRTGAHAELF